MRYYCNSRGENVILDFIRKQQIKDQVKLIRALKGLEDGSEILNIKACKCQYENAEKFQHGNV